MITIVFYRGILESVLQANQKTGNPKTNRMKVAPGPEGAEAPAAASQSMSWAAPPPGDRVCWWPEKWSGPWTDDRNKSERNRA